MGENGMGNKKFMIISLFFMFTLIGCTTISTKETSSVTTSNQTRETTATKTEGLLTDPDEIVIDFNDLLIKKSELYEMMKFQYGLSVMYKEIDKVVLKDYLDQVDELELETEIQKLRDENPNTFYEELAYAGIYPIGDETIETPSFVARYSEYFKYKFNLVHKAAGAYRAERELTQEEIQKSINEYKPDECIIDLKNSSKRAHDEAYSSLANLEGQDLLNKVIELYQKQITNASEGDEIKVIDNTAEEIFFEKMVNCEIDVNGEKIKTERVMYNDASSLFQNFVYSIEQGKISTKIISLNYHIIYKVSQAKAVKDYSPIEQKEFEKLMIARLVKIKNSYLYIRETVLKLRKDAGFKIYDLDLAKQYTDYDFDFKVSLSDNPYAVYEINNQVITADAFYNNLKTSGAALILLDRINYAAISQIEEIALTEDEKKAFMDQVLQLRSEILGSGMDMSWQDYMNLFGASSETELANLISLEELTNRFILGYKVDHQIKFAGVNPVTHEEIMTRYDEWFEITASHILFKFDQDDEVARQKAELLAKQVIAGYSSLALEEKNILKNSDFIRYDYNGDGQLGKTADELNQALEGLSGDAREIERIELEEYFQGLENTPSSNYAKVFFALAIGFSEDIGSSTSGGSLGSFGLGTMVKKFEDAALEVAERKNDFPFSNLEKDTEGNYISLAETEFGLHIIYVSGEINKTPIPAGYEHATIDEMRNVASNTELKAYYLFLVELENQLKEEHLNQEIMNKYFINLRNEHGFKFLDTDLEDYLNKIEVSQLREN
jgi:hypothetical protein